MATVVQMNVTGYPEVVVEDLKDAQDLVAVLKRIGIEFNLRNVETKAEAWWRIPKPQNPHLDGPVRKKSEPLDPNELTIEQD